MRQIFLSNNQSSDWSTLIEVLLLLYVVFYVDTMAPQQIQLRIEEKSGKEKNRPQKSYVAYWSCGLAVNS